jgi:hypothetical protein
MGFAEFNIGRASRLAGSAHSTLVCRRRAQRYILPAREISFVSRGTGSILAAYRFVRRDQVMLLERGLKVMNVEAVGDAYAIAANYLRKSGAIPDTYLTNDRLLEIIVRMFHRGEDNKLRLANKAIAQFQAARAEAA